MGQNYSLAHEIGYICNSYKLITLIQDVSLCNLTQYSGQIQQLFYSHWQLELCSWKFFSKCCQLNGRYLWISNYLTALCLGELWKLTLFLCTVGILAVHFVTIVQYVFLLLVQIGNLLFFWISNISWYYTCTWKVKFLIHFFCFNKEYAVIEKDNLQLFSGKFPQEKCMYGWVGVCACACMLVHTHFNKCCTDWPIFIKFSRNSMV
jgi:hypothetical protein